MRIPEKFKTGETLKKDIGPKLNAIVEFIKTLIPHGDGRTVQVRHTDNGCFFSAKSRGGGPGGGASEEYDGPFAVSRKDDTTVTVKEGSVIAGITEKSVVDTDVTISAECVLYMELTYVDSAYSVAFKTASSMPALSTSNYTEQLASITFEDSKIKNITQVWASGNIKVIGRVC